MANDELGRWRTRPLHQGRLLAIDAYTVLEGGHSMVALLELDVQRPVEAIARLQVHGVRLSLFSFVLRAIAVALHESPELNVMRHGREVVLFDDVDIGVPMELDAEEKGAVPRRLLIRHADQKSAADIYQEIEAARHVQAPGVLAVHDRLGRPLLNAAEHLPRAVRQWIMRRMVRDPWSAKRHGGTTSVTSVAKMSSAPGFVLPLTGTPHATLFAVGSVVEKPVVREGRVVPRKVMTLTAVFDHDVVDGAPAARFISRLQQLIETAAALEPISIAA